MDPYGLLTDTQFNLKKEISRDMFTDIQLMVSEGLNADLSIGYDVVRRDENDSRKITEYRLWEYSFLTSWGANQLATVQGLKGISRVNGYLEILTKQYNLPYSDTRLRQIETLLKSLDEAPPADPGTPPGEPKVEAVELANKIRLTYKNL
jgi:hypothetical protein